MKTKQFILSTLFFCGFLLTTNAQLTEDIDFDNLLSNEGGNKTLTFNILNNGSFGHYRFISVLHGISVTPNGSLRLQAGKPGDWNNVMSFKGTNVGIGSLHPTSKLTVKGKIHAEEVKVDLNVPSDFVFEKYFNGFSTLKPEYRMPTLKEVEDYIQENKHLPEIPSAEEIQQNGLHLGEMTNLLLQKIEELTLYTIEQEKRISELESLIEEDE